MTSARPIIRAAAVDAVRAGFRIAFSRASDPETPPNRRERAAERRDASGRAELRRGQRHADEQPEHAEGERRRAGGRRRRRGRTARSRAARRPAATIASATAVRYRAKRPAGQRRRPRGRPRSAAPSSPCTAGAMLAITRDDRAEHASRRSRVRGLEHRAGLGQVEARSPPSAPEALARVRRRARARARRRRCPSTSPSASTERSTWRREAPSVRRVASSRARWATVIESVLKMTNAPTKSATAPNASRKYWMNFVNSATSFALAFACSAPVRTWAEAGRSGSISRTSDRGETPGFADDRDQVVAVLAQELLGRSACRRSRSSRRRASRRSRTSRSR